MGKTLDNNDLNQVVESGGAKREKNRKKIMVALLVFVLAILETFFNEEKNRLTKKIYLAIMFSTIHLYI